MTLAAGSASAAVLVTPPTTFVLTNQDVTQGVDITTGDLSGEDTLVITYSVTRGDLTAGDAWVTTTFNASPDSLFTFGSVFSGLLRTATDDTPNHSTMAGGSWSSGDASSVDFDAVSPAEHAMRWTVDGLSSGGFTGVKNITWEIDHNASSFATADRTYTSTIDFGVSDVGLEIDFHSFGGKLTGEPRITPDHTVNNFTVSAVPEPSAFALLGLGGLALILRRRK